MGSKTIPYGIENDPLGSKTGIEVLISGIDDWMSGIDEWMSGIDEWMSGIDV